jgi:hypothetical protein
VISAFCFPNFCFSHTCFPNFCFSESVVVRRFEIWVVSLDPAVGSEKRQLGQLDPATAETVLATLRELFEE